ncbi:MAG: capsid cement protein [Pirellulales bacterium]
MSDILRWRYGDTSPIVLPVDSATVIEIGDLVYLDTDDAKPAGSLADAGTEAANQEAFHDAFAGVAMQRSRAGDTAPIRVATRGVFDFPCPSATFEVGALIGASENGAGNALEDQQVEGVATANLSIGRCAKRVNPAATTVLVEIVSTISHAGPQTVA